MYIFERAELLPKPPVKEIPRQLSLEQVSKLETRFPIEKMWVDEKAYLDRLTTEIKAEGITEPVTIRVRSDGSLIVWDGIHRLAVAQKLGIKNIPVTFIGDIDKLPETMVTFKPPAVDDLLPMPPGEGPPLPKSLGLKWPWKGK